MMHGGSWVTWWWWVEAQWWVWCGVEVVLDGCGGGVWGEVGSHGHGGLGISNLERMDKKKYHKFW